MANPVKTNAIRLLESGGIAFTAYEYDIADGEIDAQSIARKLGVEPDRVFKTLVAENPDKEHFVFVVPAAGSLNLKKAAKTAQAKSIAMIKQKELLPLTGYIHGGCSPIGMKKLFETVIDVSAEDKEKIIVSAGKIGRQVEIALSELRLAIKISSADITR